MIGIKSKLLALIAITCYLSLLVPTTIISNTGESGIILESQSVQYQSIPRDIQDLLPHQGDYYITIIDDLSSKERYAVISEQMWYGEGRFVRVGDITNEWYSDSRIFSSMVSQPFDKVIIGEIEEVTVGGRFVEAVVYSERGGIFLISRINFFMGGFFLILILSILFNDSVSLWNIPGILSCYSFQLFISTMVALMNKAEFDGTSTVYGLFFVVLIPLAIWLQRYEETEEGQMKILELYNNKKKMALALRRYLYKECTTQG